MSKTRINSSRSISEKARLTSQMDDVADIIHLKEACSSSLWNRIAPRNNKIIRRSFLRSPSYSAFTTPGVQAIRL